MLEKHALLVEEDLLNENSNQLLIHLRQLGRPIKQAWDTDFLQNEIKIPENYKFTSDPDFKEFLVNTITTKIATSKTQPANTVEVDPEQQIQQLKKKLSFLALFLTVWEDNPNVSESPESNTEKKELRQEIKYKSSLDKNDRYAINIALQSITFILCQQSNQLIENKKLTEKLKQLKTRQALIDFIHQQDYQFIENEDLTEQYLIEFIHKQHNQSILNVLIADFKKLDTKQALRKFISDQIKNLNQHEPSHYQKVNNDDSLASIQAKIKKIGEAIAAFITTNKKKKLIKYFGVVLAFIASLACGLSTGAGIFLLISNLPVALAIGALICAFGFYSNFKFFSVNFPDFLLSLLKKGGITEYHVKGKSQQLSTTYKFLLLPVVLASITVGAGTTALTYTAILSFLVKIVPVLLLISPPLPLIILWILAVSVGITLTVAVLTASIGLLKEIAELNLTFTELCMYAYISCIDWCINFKHLKPHQKVGYFITFVLLPIALLGLLYFRITAGIDLAQFTNVIGAAIMGVIAYLAQTPFTVKSANKLGNILIKAFSSTTQDDNTSTPKNFLSQLKSYVFYPLCLVGNAFGNALLVYDGSLISVFAAIACFFNSLAGNLPEPDNNQCHRNQANKLLAKEVEKFNAETRKTTPASSKDLKAEKNLLNNKSSDSYIKEPDSQPSSPTTSLGEEGAFAMGSHVENKKFISTYNPSNSQFFTVEKPTIGSIDEPPEIAHPNIFVLS